MANKKDIDPEQLAAEEEKINALMEEQTGELEEMNESNKGITDILKDLNMATGELKQAALKV